MYPCHNIKKNMGLKDGLETTFKTLYDNFGPQDWWPAESKLEIIIGAILTQAVSWSNVEIALNNLKNENVLNIDSLNNIDQDDLAELIKASGYYNMKAKKIKAFIHFIIKEYNGDLNILVNCNNQKIKNELLEVYGIGPETADSILLYAYQKPFFVIDRYTRRILTRIGYIKEGITYDRLQYLFIDNLSKDFQLYNEFHALLVNLGKNYCLKNSPICKECPLQKFKKEERDVSC